MRLFLMHGGRTRFSALRPLPILFGLLLLAAAPVRAALPSPIDYGAQGNGLADDTAAFAAALAANKSLGLLGNTYRITAGLQIPTSATLVGPGAIVVDYDTYNANPANTALRLLGNGVTLKDFVLLKRYAPNSVATGISGTGLNGLHIEGLQIKGYGAGAGIRLQNSTNLMLSSLWLHSFRLDQKRSLSPYPMAGLLLIDCTLSAIRDCRFDHLELAGEVISFAPAGQPQGYRSAGIYLERCRGILVLQSTFAVMGVGVQAVDTQNSTIVGNFLRDTYGSAISLRRSSYNAITGNRIDSCGQGILTQGDDPTAPNITPGPLTCNGNAIKGNLLTDIGAPGYFGVAGSARTGVSPSNAIGHYTGNTYSLTNSNLMARTPRYPTGPNTLENDNAQRNTSFLDNLSVGDPLAPRTPIPPPAAVPNPPTERISIKNQARYWTLMN